MWNITKALLLERFIALNTSIKKQERTKTNELSFQLKKWEKEQLPWSEPKELRRKKKAKMEVKKNTNKKKNYKVQTLVTLKLAYWWCLSFALNSSWHSVAEVGRDVTLICFEGYSPSWQAGIMVCGSTAGGMWGSCYLLTSQWTRKQRKDRTQGWLQT